MKRIVAFLLLSLLLAVSLYAIGPYWLRLYPVLNPGNRDGHSLAWDETAQRAILYGSHSGSPQTWAYDPVLNTWANLNTPTNPGLQAHFPMIYDSQNQRTILHNVNGTWVYDSTANQWVNRFPAMPSVIQSKMTVMAYDSESDRTIFFSAETGETWAYDYQNNAWQNMKPPAPTPPKDWRGPSATAVYLPLYDRVILVMAFDSRTWAYDYNTNRWTQRALGPIRGSPGNNNFYYLAYQDSTDKTLYYGDDQQTWIYDYPTDTWTNLGFVGPPAHHFNVAGMSGKVLLYGGVIPNQNQTWLFDANGN